MQAPGICTELVAERSVTVTPAAVEASAAVTSVHASTFEIRVALEFGVGEGLTEEPVEDVDGLEDPHALTTRPAIATRTITLLADAILATADWIRAASAGVILEPSLARGGRRVKRIIFQSN